MAITNEPKEALIEDLQTSHPGRWRNVCMAQQYWWPNMKRDLLVFSIEYKSCTAIGKNSKSVILLININRINHVSSLTKK